MSNPFIGQLKMFGGNFAPEGWQLCDGTLLSISEYDTLYTLLGTTYGGDGVSTFGVPDLRGRVPIGPGTDKDGNAYAVGVAGGSESVALTDANIPAHNHAFVVSSAPGTLATPGNNLLAATPDGVLIYKTANPTGTFAAAITPLTGAAHENRQPFIAINYIIATAGVYPSQG
jgi:microcystin-dependent protein